MKRPTRINHLNLGSLFSFLLSHRVRHDIPGTIGRDDFGASQGAKSAHTGSMEAMSDAGSAKKRPALPIVPRLFRDGPLDVIEISQEGQ